MPILTFARAVRAGAPILLGLVGQSNSGKTLSALYIARGLVGPKGRIGYIDTEQGRALIYAAQAGGFDHANLTGPFTPERYVEALEDASAAKFDAVILDSGSHEWEGIGGVLDLAEASGFTGLVKWAQPKARHKKFVQTLIHFPHHLIVCFREKEKLVQTGKGREAEITSKGMVPIQDKSLIYEMTIQLRLDPAHPGMPIIQKCPDDLLGAFPEGKLLDIETGAMLREWVQGGAPIDNKFLEAKRSAERAAGQGREAFLAHWKGLDRATRAALKAQLPNLESIAGAADRSTKDAEEAAAILAREEASAKRTNLADPFGAAASEPESKRLAEAEPFEIVDASGSVVMASRDARAVADRLCGMIEAIEQPDELGRLDQNNMATMMRLPEDMRTRIESTMAAQRKSIRSGKARKK